MSTPGVVEMEVALHRRDSLSWAVEVRVNDYSSDEVTTQEGQVDIELPQLELLDGDLDGYARYLSEALWADDAVRTGFANARRAAADARGELRIRLRIGSSAPDLHGVRWELLRDPDHMDANLATQENVVFSRYLESRDYRNVEVRPGEAMRALVAVAGPPAASLTEYEADGRSLSPVDVGAEITRAEAALAGSEVTTLGDDEPVTLERLIDGLRAGPDILYLVCHGYINKSGRDRGPRLLLQSEDGTPAVVTGRELVTRLRELLVLPRLVVLASCMSAASETADDGAMAAVGPEIAAIGVPAVVAMQDNVTMQTVETMMPVFFRELRDRPQIDRAFSVARGHVRDRPDWWVPVLFMRLKSGRIWYEPGFAGGVDEWGMLLDQIGRVKLTPVLGPGLTDGIIGSRRELARSWARAYKYPIPPPRDEDLPQVAQYVAKFHGDPFLRDSLRDAVAKRILDNFRPALADRLGSDELDTIVADGSDPEKLIGLVRAVGEIRRADDPYEPHKVLAALPLPLYLTTEVSGLLADAVEATGNRSPVSEFFQWTDRDDVDWGLPTLDDPAATRGTKTQPLLYSLFGDLRLPGSVVLSEDDYFEFLTSFSSEGRRRSIPTQIMDALVNTSLLFVGFRIDDWDFHVLYRAIMSLEGRRKGEGYPHVAVQLDPEASSHLDSERVRSYLERYFGRNFTIYWGSSAVFLRQLAVKWEARERSRSGK
jgi:hypothetical protein